MLMVYLGMVQFLEVPYVQIFLWLFGAFVLIYSGAESIKGANTITLNYKGKRILY
jgi:threonine/homoserine/homoserine lactone efflux protein